jgi:hypothetical protein
MNIHIYNYLKHNICLTKTKIQLHMTLIVSNSVDSNFHVLTGKFDLTNVNNMAFYISRPKLLFEKTEISTGVKLYIFIHNKVRDFTGETSGH